MDKKIRLFKLGFEDSMGLKAGGIFVLLFGGAALLFEGWPGIPLLVVALVLLTSRTGVAIDVEKRQVQHFTNLMGFRLGKWYPASRYNSVFVLYKRRKSKSEIYDMSFFQAITLRDQVYELYLGNGNHLYTILISRTFKKEPIEEYARELADLLGYPYVAYNPGKRRPIKVYYQPEATHEA